MRTSNRDVDLLKLAERRGLLTAAQRERLDELLGEGGNAAELLVTEGGLSSGAVRDLVDHQRRRSVPSRIGGYRIIKEIGRGGMGLVYRAEQRHGGDGLPVAIKLLEPSKLGDRSKVGRFMREIEMTRNVVHPDLVSCLETGVAEGKPYLVLEFMAGGDLGNAAPVDDERALRAVAACARGAQAIHDVGWVHRDIKPGNIMLDAEGRPRLGDFGLAKAAESEDGEALQDLTMHGHLVGTPPYLAPELALGEKADQLSDVYALGATLYHLVSGRPPYRAATPMLVVRAVASGPPPELAELAPDSSRGLRRIVETAMARDPLDRYPSAAAMADDCQRLLDGHQPVGLGRRRWKVLGLLARVFSRR